MSSPVIIIGAPRSGTNMLRDVLSRLPGWSTWPCDEINFIWRHGNRDHPDDELAPDHADASVRRYVRSRFEQIARRRNARVVLEKTCANSLRVGFVRRIVPEARFLFIHRHGLDAAASAMQRWHAPIDFPYLARKARYVPGADVPYYGARFVRGRLRGSRSIDRAPGTWGPRTVDMDAMVATRPLDEVCGLQWQRCVESAAAGLAGLPAEKVHEISYETFVSEPRDGLRNVLDFLKEGEHMDPGLVDGVNAHSVGKGRRSLTTEQTERLSRMMRPTLEKLGYA